MDSSSDDSSSDSSDGSSESSDESSSSDIEEHSTMTSEEEDTEAEVKNMERRYKIGQKVAVFPDKDSYRVNHVIGTIRQVVKVKGDATKYFGIHLTDTTSRGLGVKLQKRSWTPRRSVGTRKAVRPAFGSRPTRSVITS